jgi:hypothetical protein
MSITEWLTAQPAEGIQPAVTVTDEQNDWHEQRVTATAKHMT